MSAIHNQVQVPCMISIKNEPSSVADHIKFELQQSTWNYKEGVKLEFNSQDDTCSIKQEPEQHPVHGVKREDQLLFKQEEDPSHMVKLEHATHIEQSDCGYENTLKLEYHFQYASCLIKPEQCCVHGKKAEEQLVFKQERDPSSPEQLEHATHIKQSDCGYESTLKMKYHFQYANGSLKPMQDFLHREKTEEQIVIKEQDGSQKEKIETDRHAMWQVYSDEKSQEMSAHKCKALEVMNINTESQQNQTNCDAQTYPHQCNSCEASFKTLSNLNQHMQVHNDLKPIQCSLCKATFRRSSHLKRHMLVHSDVKPIQCSLCEAKFKSSSRLKQHMLVHSDLKSYHCTLCKATFKRSSYLKSHMVTHSDVKPLQCSLCEATFKRSNHLKRHMLVHSDMKP